MAMALALAVLPRDDLAGVSSLRDTVFIHSNQKQRLAALVSAFSLKARSSAPEDFDVQILWAEDFPFIATRDGQAYLREGRRVVWTQDDLQSFTPIRFAIPHAMENEGRAVVIDPDVFAVGDVRELLQREMGGHSVLAKRMPADGRKPMHWASSVMLLDCSRLGHWRCEEDFGRLFAFERDYIDWMWLLLEPETTVGQLEEQWNHFDTLDATTKLLHNTHRRTQPWKTGLPADFTPRGRHLEGANASLLERVRARIWGEPTGPRGHYKRHPDPAQEQFFFSLLRECLAEGVIPRALVEEEIERCHVRRDALSLVESVKGSRASASLPRRAVDRRQGARP